MRAQETRSGGRYIAKRRGLRRTEAPAREVVLPSEEEWRAHGKAMMAELLPSVAPVNLMVFRGSLSCADVRAVAA